MTRQSKQHAFRPLRHTADVKTVDLPQYVDYIYTLCHHFKIAKSILLSCSIIFVYNIITVCCSIINMVLLHTPHHQAQVSYVLLSPSLSRSASVPSTSSSPSLSPISIKHHTVDAHIYPQFDSDTDDGADSRSSKSCHTTWPWLCPRFMHHGFVDLSTIYIISVAETTAKSS